MRFSHRRASTRGVEEGDASMHQRADVVGSPFRCPFLVDRELRERQAEYAMQLRVEEQQREASYKAKSLEQNTLITAELERRNRERERQERFVQKARSLKRTPAAARPLPPAPSFSPVPTGGTRRGEFRHLTAAQSHPPLALCHRSARRATSCASCRRSCRLRRRRSSASCRCRRRR